MAQPSKSYFYKIPYPLDVGSTRYRANFISKDATLIYQRNPLKFENLSVTNTK
mgnify:FL=1